MPQLEVVEVDVDAGVALVRYPLGTPLTKIEAAFAGSAQYACAGIDLIRVVSHEDGFDVAITLDRDVYAPDETGRIAVAVTAHDYRTLEPGPDAAPTIALTVSASDGITVAVAEHARAEPLAPEASARFATAFAIAPEAKPGDAALTVRLRAHWSLGRVDAALEVGLLVR